MSDNIRAIVPVGQPGVVVSVTRQITITEKLLKRIQSVQAHPDRNASTPKTEQATSLTSIDQDIVSHQMPEETGGRSEEVSYDESLFALLKKKRLDMAEEAGVPPYVLFSDKSLHQMSSFFPQSPVALLAINGLGQVKCERYGKPFLEIITRYLADNPDVCVLQTERMTAQERDTAPKQTGVHTLDETLLLAETGMSVEAIADERQLKTSTIASHIGELLQRGKWLDVDLYVVPAIRDEMTELFRLHGLLRLKPIVDAMEGRAGYNEAHIVRGFLLSQGWSLSKLQD